VNEKAVKQGGISNPPTPTKEAPLTGPSSFRLDEVQFKQLQRTVLVGLVGAGYLAGGKQATATVQNMKFLGDFARVLEELL